MHAFEEKLHRCCIDGLILLFEMRGARRVWRGVQFTDFFRSVVVKERVSSRVVFVKSQSRKNIRIYNKQTELYLKGCVWP